MRSYTSTLLFEDAIDLLPYGSETWHSVKNIFTPTVQIVEIDCGTLIGEKQKASLDLLGAKENGAGSITRDRLNNASGAGQTYLYLKTLSTCVSQGGLCKTCYERTTNIGVNVGDYVSIPPEFIIQVENISVPVGGNTCNLTFDSDVYDSLLIFVNSAWLTPMQYTLIGTSLILASPVDVESGGVTGYGTVTIKYLVNTKTPYVYWLASTFSGSLLGMSPLPARPLRISPLLHGALLPYGDVEKLTLNVLQSPLTPAPILDYIPRITDPLEKAVLVALLNSIYLPQAEVPDAPVSPPPGPPPS